MLPEDNIAEDGHVFGLEVINKHQLIGNVYVFLDSLAELLETVNDKAPIIDNRGTERGKLTYSIVPKLYDNEGEETNLMLVESIEELLNRKLSVQVNIQEAKEIPEKFSTDVFAQYKWIDELAEMFRTDTSGLEKNKNPAFSYKQVHELVVTDYIAKNIADGTLIISLYGKMPNENMESLTNQF